MTQTRSDEQSLGDLVAGATAQVQKLVKAEIALAKSELKHDVKNAGVGAGLFGGAAFLGYFALLFLSVAGGYGLHALGLGLGWSFLIVGGVYLLLTAILALVGKSFLAKMTGVERTKKTIADDVAWAKDLKNQIGKPAGDQQLEAGGQQPPAIERAN